MEINHQETSIWPVMLDKRGRLTIPAVIRRKLNLRPGQKIILDTDSSGVIATPVTD